jgi:hypothetical protein
VAETTVKNSILRFRCTDKAMGQVGGGYVEK